MKKALLFSVIVLGAARCHAGPIVTANVTPLGGGIYGFDVFIDDPADQKASWFVTQLTFTGNIMQLKAGPASVNDNVNAGLFDGFFGYNKLLDSYFFEPFTSRTESPGIVETSSSYAITAGSGGGSELDKVQIAYLAVAGESVQYSGTISRLGVDYAVSGILAVPEPATWLLLALGAAAAAIMHRRRGNR
jgi:hypothetical protein